MTQAFLLAKDCLPPSAASAAALYACTGCMRCRTFCGHENEVGPALFAARALAVEHHLAPAGAQATIETFRQYGNPFGPLKNELPRAQKAFAGAMGMPVFVGCTALMKRQSLLEDLRAFADEYGFPFQLSDLSDRCCGYPLYAAGDTQAFRQHAMTMVNAINGTAELAVLDPGCAYTLSVVYPRHGITIDAGIRTVTSLFAEHSSRLRPPPLQRRVAYFDACHLGRGLGEYDEPRSLLRYAVEELTEAGDARREGGCSGGGGLLPRTMPEVSREMAKEAGSDFSAVKTMVAVACVTSLRQFERAGYSAQHLISILRTWLCG